jgi:hypothetical protein
MSIVTSLLNRFGFLAPLKLTNASFRSVLTLVRASFPMIHANIGREWSSQRDAEQFQMNVLQRRDLNEAVGRLPVAR